MKENGKRVRNSLLVMVLIVFMISGCGQKKQDTAAMDLDTSKTESTAMTVPQEKPASPETWTDSRVPLSMEKEKEAETYSIVMGQATQEFGKMMSW